MSTKELIKELIDQIPDEKNESIESLLRGLLVKSPIELPKANLGLKEQINRESIYDDVIVS